MAATTKLIVWNAALRELGSAPLADTTTANTRQYELNAAWDHAIEYVLALRDWGFARRRATLTGVSNTTSFPPYTFQYTKPSDYLRKCWLKTSADDDFQIDHAEVAAVIYGLQPTALVEYISDHSDNYNPANWPPHFTRVVTLHLASLVSSKLARAGAGEIGMLDGKMGSALEEAEGFESIFLTNVRIAANRQPVFRRALEFLGQELAGTVAVHAHADMLRWHMNRSWNHALKYVLEQAAWNFAARRVRLTGGSVLMPGGEVADIIEGHAAGTGPTEPTPIGAEITEGYVTTEPDALEDLDETPVLAEYPYGFYLPSGFLHKIWIKADATHDTEARHQFLGQAVYTAVEPVIMEYIALDDDSSNPELWSANFLEVVAAYLALLVCTEIVVVEGKKGFKVNANQLRDKLQAVFRMKLSDAKLRDAIQQDAQRIPLGRFARSRMGSIGTTSVRRYN